MTVKKEIICVSGKRKRTYYNCGILAVEYLDGEGSVIKHEGNIPNGDVLVLDGEFVIEKSFFNGKPNGTLKLYRRDSSTILLLETYKHGVLDGVRIEYFDDNKPRLEENYKEGKLHGKSTEYYRSGNVHFEDTYSNGVLVERKEFKDVSCEKPVSANAAERIEKLKSTGKTRSFEQTDKTSGLVRRVSGNQRIYFKGGAEIAREVLSRSGAVIDFYGSIPDGLVREYYLSGKIKYEETYKDNKLNGVRKKYDELGRLWAEESCVDNKLEGLVKVHNYFKNKVFEEEAYFKNNKLHGLRKTYYTNGNMSVEENYIEGRLDGIRKSYYENGKINTEENYVCDRLSGIRRRRYDNGRIWNEEYYSGGKLEGDRKDYYLNGRLRLEESYKDGKLEGVRKIYREDGFLIREETYTLGKLVSKKEHKKT